MAIIKYSESKISVIDEKTKIPGNKLKEAVEQLKKYEEIKKGEKKEESN